MAYADVQLYIDGGWREGRRPAIPVSNPATGAVLGHVACASERDLEDAVAAAARGFAIWRRVPALQRSQKLRRVADLLRERKESIARILTLEQGKPIAQARGEIGNCADIFDWFAEEGRRTYGRIIPSRAPEVVQSVVKEPVGPVAAFTPWNFPMNQTSRKLAAALAAGCSIVVKAAEDTPGAVAELFRILAEAGIPKGVANLVYGVPAEISAFLIARPEIRKVSFTGSTAVGKLLAEFAGKHMKRITMELGGHAPVIIFDDVAVERTVGLLVAQKYRNAGQVCIAPTRFLVQEALHDEFVERFVNASEAVTVGDGLDPATEMGPLVNARRREAVDELVEDAVARGGRMHTGGRHPANEGCFYCPTVLTGVPKSARILNEEPFGPVAIIAPFAEPEEALAEANRLPYGLASYVYTGSSQRAAQISAGIESGMVSINHHGLGLIETPFGGVKDSGYGSEGGLEAIEAYLVTKTVSHYIGAGI